METFEYTQFSAASPIPVCRFYISSGNLLSSIRGDGILDTGADCTLFSSELIPRINSGISNAGKPIPIPVLGNNLLGVPYLLYIGLSESNLIRIKAYACHISAEDLGAHLLIGRNYLNRYLIEFDGPNEIFSIHDD